jgi:hypothetical protein
MGNQINICYDNNVSYVGQIKKNKYHGNGTIYYNETGNLYKGQFKEGLKHGIGEFQFYNGDKYIGNFYQDEIHGNGKYILTNGYIYEGDFTIGSMLGKGQMYDVNNELIYDGEFLNSLPHGFGISYINKQIEYIGNWNQNFYNGYGILFNKNSYKYGLFKEGELIEKIEQIPMKFMKYINKNKKELYDSNINLSKYITANNNPVYGVIKEQFINPESSTTPLEINLSSCHNKKNNIPVIKSVFNPLNVR